ncbi:MAG: class I SAM-dependent RNA methyltransferase [Muribaculaceae bacterium]
MEFEMIAKTFQGLEGVLAEELRQLGANNVEEGLRMVSFTGDKAILYKANFCCRTALRILKPIYKFLAGDADELYEAVKRFDWEQVLTADQTFAIDATVFSEEFRHSRFATYRVKDAIADFFNEKYGRRPSIRLNNPDVQFNVHIAGKEVTLSLDSSGEPLYKRGYRVAQTEAPINEVLAAGILKLAGWDGQCNLVDPMCGSGTFLIEAALMAANVNPGVFRQNFAFENWPDFDADLFDSIYNDDSGEREFEFKIYGSDISAKAIEISERNIKSARVGKYIDLKCCSLQSIEQVEPDGMVVTNPPYGERISVEDMEGLYHDIGERLKRVFKGYKAWVIGYDQDLFDCIGLKPSVKMPMLNGELSCELREYTIFEGRYDDLRREGGSIKDEDFSRRRGDDKPYRKRKFEETFKSDRRPRHFDDDDEGERRPRHFKFDDDDRRDRRRDDDRRDRRRDDRRDRRRDDDRRDRRRDDDRRDRRRDDDRRDRRRDDDRRDRRRDDFYDGEEERPRKMIHSEEFSNRVVRFREPQLSKDKEVINNSLRHRGWKKKEAEDGGDEQ